MDYLLLKWLHIISATILFGTGIGSAFYVFMANRRRELPGICFALRHVVIADWLFTTPAVILQFVTGILLVRVVGYSFSEVWITWALILYMFAGACWLPVVRMQIRMRDIALNAQSDNTPLPPEYWRLERYWTLLGALAFPAIIIVFYLMVFRPG